MINLTRNTNWEGVDKVSVGFNRVTQAKARKWLKPSNVRHATKERGTKARPLVLRENQRESRFPRVTFDAKDRLIKTILASQTWTDEDKTIVRKSTNTESNLGRLTKASKSILFLMAGQLVIGLSVIVLFVLLFVASPLRPSFGPRSQHSLS